LWLCRAAADGSTSAAADAANADFGRGRGRPTELSAPTDPAVQTTSS